MSTAAQPCPQWAEYPLDIHSGQDSPYLGCTTEYNLRAMVANPEDLEHGRSLGPADGERESRAVEAYRQGKVKAFGSGTASGSGSSASGASGSTTSGTAGP
jgi:type IV pilus biogenesis protein CpaD/CtpE